jgi:hypothetical protein
MLSPDDAHEFLGSDRLPVRVSDLLGGLGYELQANPNLKRPAVSWPNLRVVRYRPGGQRESTRESLAHELGHVCSDHSGTRFCVAHAWETHDKIEREAHRWAEEFLMPWKLLRPWIVDLGGEIRLSRLAAYCEVTPEFARRRLRRDGFDPSVWDDTTPKALRAANGVNLRATG